MGIKKDEPTEGDLREDGGLNKDFPPGRSGNQELFMLTVGVLGVYYQEEPGKPCKWLPAMEALTQELVKHALQGEEWAMKLFFDLAIGNGKEDSEGYSVLIEEPW